MIRTKPVNLLPLAMLAASVALWGCQPAEPTLIVPEGQVLSGTPIDFRLENLTPGQRVSLELERVSLRGESPALYQSLAVFEADETGKISTATHAPIKGYQGINPAGLFNNMVKTEEISVTSGRWTDIKVKADLNADGVPDLTKDFELVRGYDGLEETLLGDNFPGAFVLRPKGTGPFPLVVALGGSEGNDRGARGTAPRLASRGYAVLGLPYYSPAWTGTQKFPGLPQPFANIDTAYLEQAVDHVSREADIDGERVALYGVSKGAEYVLLAATHMPRVKAVAAIVPTDVVWEGWGAENVVSSFAYQGAPLPYVPYEGMSETMASGGDLRGPHDAGRLAHPDKVKVARIPVENIAAPVLVVGGDQDRVWDSGGMSRNIKATRDAAGLETVAFISPQAGHYLSGDGYGVGSDPADARLQREAFPALLTFLEAALE